MNRSTIEITALANKNEGTGENLVISSLIERFFKARAVRAGMIKGLGLALKIITKKCNLSQKIRQKSARS